MRDDGPGIPAEARYRIFEALFTTKAKGSGLGLALCRRIVEAHGGSIDLEPSNDRRQLRHSHRMSRTVLIVDDDDALAENLAEIVASLGVETAVARDRKTALALAAAAATSTWL